MKLIHLITLILWAFGLVNLFEPFNGITFYLASIVFYGLLTAHLIECIIYRDKILQSKDAPIIASLSHLLSSKHPNITKIPKIIEGIGNQYVPFSFSLLVILLQEVNEFNNICFLELNSSSVSMPLSFKVDNFSIFSKTSLFNFSP